MDLLLYVESERRASCSGTLPFLVEFYGPHRDQYSVYHSMGYTFGSYTCSLKLLSNQFRFNGFNGEAQ